MEQIKMLDKEWYPAELKKEHCEQDAVLRLIPYGKDNAIDRLSLCRETGLHDRQVRHAIENLRRYVPIINSGEGKGYFRPKITDKADMDALRRWISVNEARAKSVFMSLRAAKETLKEGDE